MARDQNTTGHTYNNDNEKEVDWHHTEKEKHKYHKPWSVGFISNFENVSNERTFDIKCSEYKSKMLNSQNLSKYY